MRRLPSHRRFDRTGRTAAPCSMTAVRRYIRRSARLSLSRIASSICSLLSSSNGIDAGRAPIGHRSVHGEDRGWFPEGGVGDGEWRLEGGEAGGVSEELGGIEAEDRGFQGGASSVHASARRCYRGVGDGA